MIIARLEQELALARTGSNVRSEELVHPMIRRRSRRGRPSMRSRACWSESTACLSMLLIVFRRCSISRAAQAISVPTRRRRIPARCCRSMSTMCTSQTSKSLASRIPARCCRSTSTMCTGHPSPSSAMGKRTRSLTRPAGRTASRRLERTKMGRTNGATTHFPLERAKMARTNGATTHFPLERARVARTKGATTHFPGRLAMPRRLARSHTRTANPPMKRRRMGKTERAMSRPGVSRAILRRRTTQMGKQALATRIHPIVIGIPVMTIPRQMEPNGASRGQKRIVRWTAHGTSKAPRARGSKPRTAK